MSTLKVETIQNTSALYSSTPHQIEQGRAKAHIEMKGTSTITINSSFNISSIIDNGAGKYEANLSITMSSTTFCVVGGSSQSGDRNDNIMGFNPQSATAIRMYSWNQTGSSTAGEDATFVSAAVFGDLSS